MARFEISYNRTKKFEGGYTDLDGGTNFGIIKATARRHNFQGNMKELPEELARQIARVDYFEPLKLYQVDQPIADQLYDHAFNCGTKTSAKLFQRAINDYYGFKKLKVDGIIGLITIGAYMDIKYKLTFCNIVRYFRQKYYRLIIKRKPWKKKYKNTWLRRV